MIDKAKNFIKIHGYSYIAFFVAMLVFPPAAVIIAWKKPDISIVVRIFLTLFVIILVLSPIWIPWLVISLLIYL